MRTCCDVTAPSLQSRSTASSTFVTGMRRTRYARPRLPGRLRPLVGRQGVAVDLDSIIPAGVDATQLIAAVGAVILGGAMTQHTKQVIRRQLSDVSDPVQARALAVGLALGGPEFQRQ